MEKKYPVINMKMTGQRIRWIMRMKGFTVRDLQEYLGLSTPQSIYHWFEGRSIPTVDNLYALSYLFELPMEYLLSENKKDLQSNEVSLIHRITQYCFGVSLLRAG